MKRIDQVLPQPLLRSTINNLTPKEMLLLGQVNKTFLALSKDPHFWNITLKNHPKSDPFLGWADEHLGKSATQETKSYVIFTIAAKKKMQLDKLSDEQLLKEVQSSDKILLKTIIKNEKLLLRIINHLKSFETFPYFNTQIKDELAKQSPILEAILRINDPELSFNFAIAMTDLFAKLSETTITDCTRMFHVLARYDEHFCKGILKEIDKFDQYIFWDLFRDALKYHPALQLEILKNKKHYKFYCPEDVLEDIGSDLSNQIELWKLEPGKLTSNQSEIIEEYNRLKAPATKI